MSLVELACESGYFADLNPSEIREQITSDLARKVAARLVKYHGWAKVQRLEEGQKISRFYPPSARMLTAETAPTGYTREGVIAWLLTNGLEGVNPRVVSKILRERGPEAEKRPSGLTSLAIRTPEPARTAGRQQRKTTTRRHKGAD